MRHLSLLPLLAAAGCAYTVQVVDVRDAYETTGPDYVVVKIQGGNERVYDCYSKPEGEAWNPTCVQVDMRNEARK